jgi:hypothetical protein
MVDCQDFALLHYKGAGCEGDSDKDYQEFHASLNECLAQFMQLAGSSLRM